MTRVLLLACLVLVGACEPEATRSLLERSRAERQEWLDDLRSLDAPAARARYVADLARLKELGVEPVKVGDRWTLGAEAHKGARWAVDARGATRAALDAELAKLGAARGRYLVHLLSLEKDGWRLQLTDAVEPEIRFPTLQDRGRVWKSSARKALEAEIAALDGQIDAVRAKLGVEIRPSYVATTRAVVDKAQLAPSSLGNVVAILATLQGTRTLTFSERGERQLELVVDPPLATPPPGGKPRPSDGKGPVEAGARAFVFDAPIAKQ